MAREYSPADVKLTFAGIQNVKGWNSITINRTSENYSQTVSADGNPAYTKIADKTGTMEISVQQVNAEFHLAMAGLQQVIDQTDEEVVIDATLIERYGGNTSVVQGIRLNMMASQNFEAEQADRTYSFLIERVDYVPTPEGLSDQVREVANAKSFANTIRENAGL